MSEVQQSHPEDVRYIRNFRMSGQTELIIPVPVIPGFNDTEKELLDIAEFADSLPGVRQIHLLLYIVVEYC